MIFSTFYEGILVQAYFFLISPLFGGASSKDTNFHEHLPRVLGGYGESQGFLIIHLQIPIDTNKTVLHYTP